MPKNMFAFPKQDTYVSVPRYHRIGTDKWPIKVKPLDIDETLALSDLDPRTVINFEIVYVDNDGEHLLKEIRPYFEMWLGYKASEKDHSLIVYIDGVANPDLPKERRRRPLGHTKTAQEHTHALGLMAGYGYARESEWGDPNLGWG